MTARSALTVVGQLAGAYLTAGSPYGAAIGGFIGGTIGGAIDGPQRNTQGLIDDLNAIKFDYGSSWPRIYGVYRAKISPMWTSPKRPVEHTENVDEKGGEGAVNTTITYVQDWWCWCPLNADGFSRAWVNGEIKYSARPDSDSATLAASLNTDAWASATFMDGGPTQMPWSIYEAAVGTANAVAMRFRPTLAIDSTNLGPSGQPPLIEVEFVAGGTVSVSKLVETIYEVSLSDPQNTTDNVSGIASYIGPGHAWFWPQFDSSYLNRNYTTNELQLFPPWVKSTSSLELPDLTGQPPGVGSENFMNGMSDVSYWVAVGNNGMGAILTQDSNGAAFVDDDFNTATGYAHYSGSTLFMLAGSSPFTTFPRGIRLGGGVVTVPTSYAPSNATRYASAWYVLPTISDGSIYSYNLTTLAGIGTIADPRTVGNSGGTLLTDATTGDLYILLGSALMHYTGAAWESFLTALPAEMQGMNGVGVTIRGGTLHSIALISPGTFRYSTCRSAQTVTANPVSLADIVRAEALLEWSGVDGALTADDIDVTELESIMVTGYATTGSPRESIAQLMDVFYFGCVCSDKLYFRLRGAASIGTVPFDQTGMGVGQPGEPFTGLERGNDLEVPMQVAVTGPNILADYDPGTENSDRLIGESVELRQYNTPVVFTPAQRKGRAQTMVLDARAASHTAKVVLDDRHVEKEPFDVWIQTDDQGNQYRVRSNGESFADGIHDHDVVLDDTSVLVDSGITAARDSRAITIVAVPTTLVVPLDIPIVRDLDNSRGIYAAAKPFTTGPWSGWDYLQSSDNVTFTQVAGGTKATVIGTCSVVPGNFAGGRVFDEFDSIVVDVGAGSLATVTNDQIIADETVNAFAIGAPGRWLLGQFRSASLLSAGVYRLRGLILGSKGTEQHIGTQVVGDTFVLLKPTGGVLRVPQAAIDHGSLRYYKGVSKGRSSDSVGAATITEQEVGLMPLSAFGLSITRDPSGNATIAWERRTRAATRISGPAGILIPLGEDSESWSIDICSSVAFTTIKRTLASTSESVVYSAADQTSDFGSLQDPIYAVVYQLSAQVGRGFPAEVAT